MYRQKTLFEITLETINFYSKNPECRSLGEDTNCLYAPSEHSPGCAVGRVIDRTVCQLQEGRCASTTFNAMGSREKYNPHKHNREGYKVGGIKFWEDLQNFHDNSNYWDGMSGELTLEGHAKAKQLLDRYRNA